MTRTLKGAIALLALCAAAPAIAADYPELRSAYPNDWSTGDDNPLRFESGLRYWYSWGGQDAAFTGLDLTTRDNTHFGEIHGRIDDFSTQTYVKAQAGLGVATSGSFSLNASGPGASSKSGEIARGNIGYVGADFGWLPFGDQRDGMAIGGLAGYQYWQDSPDIGRGNYVTSVDGNGIPSGGASSADVLDIHALRLGVTGTASLGQFADIRAEVAAVPYAHVSGVLGPHEFNVPGAIYKSSPTTLSGRGYGAMGELMIGFHPTENLTVRVGGRAWYLEGALDGTFDSKTVTPDADPTKPPTVGDQSFIFKSSMASVFRYGAMFELTGRF